MKLVLLVTAFSIFAAGSASAQSVKRDEALGKEIRRLDLAHADAIPRRDVAALNELLAEDVTTNHPTNKVVKERVGIFEPIRGGVINYSSFVREPETFLFYKNMVVVMGHETIVPAGDAPRRGPDRATPLHERLDEAQGQVASGRATRERHLPELSLKANGRQSPMSEPLKSGWPASEDLKP